MENASKALIIAGAILLSILIIGLAMFIFNTASDTLEKTASRMGEQEKSTHNQRFQKFEGDRRSGSDVKSLINELVQNYSTQVQNGEMMRSPGVVYTARGRSPVTVSELGEEVDDDAFNNLTSDIKTTRSYRVVINVNAKAGIVDLITITENN